MCVSPNVLFYFYEFGGFIEDPDLVLIGFRSEVRGQG